MKGKEIYPLVYRIVKRAQNENPNLKKYLGYYQWSKSIPAPINISDELADALCTSVSSSKGVGLEIYFQEKVFQKDLQFVSLEFQLTELLINITKEGEKYETLGEIIREVFEGRMVPNDSDIELLKNL
jgi:hypothetical protein